MALSHRRDVQSGFRIEGNPWAEQLQLVARRYDQEFSKKSFDLPPEVEAMAIAQEWRSGQLGHRTASSFWELAQPKRRQHCLDIGCGVGFLVYPWLAWEACFYGHDICKVAQQALNSRAPQLNSKLFKGCRLAPAHRLDYEENFFDLVISTGVSCYYGLDYWDAVLSQVKRVLKPGGLFVFDVINPELPLAENWAILEIYLGAEVYLEDVSAWSKLIKAVGARIVSSRENELFRLLKVKW